MNFSQMHERLRVELLRRIQRGTASVSLLSRQTGFGQAHISNFLRCRRQLSLAAMDRILTAQHLEAGDLLPAYLPVPRFPVESSTSRVPLVSHATALFEPHIRDSAILDMLEMPFSSSRWRPPSGHVRRMWERFVAISVSPANALPMDPVVTPDALLLLDRHYVTLVPYRPMRPNLYAVRRGSRLALRYVDFDLNRLILRPHDIGHPVDLIEIEPGKTPSDYLAGRVALVLNEL